MLRVSLALLIFVYLFIFLTAIFGLWIWYEVKRQRRERFAVRHRVRCSVCAFLFEDPSGETLPRCPRCGSLNERRRISLL